MRSSKGCEKFKMTNDYLAHYGIKGMHWGVRRYQNPDGSLTAEGKKRYGGSEKWERRADKAEAKRDAAISKIGTSKTRIGKFVNNDRAALNQYVANVSRDMANANTVGKKVGALVGHGNTASMHDASEDFYARQKEYRKTKLGKHLSGVQEFNSHSAGTAAENIYQAKGVSKKVKNYIKGELVRPTKTLVGRETRSGERYVNALIGKITQSTIGVSVNASRIADVGYLGKKVYDNIKAKRADKVTKNSRQAAPSKKNTPYATMKEVSSIEHDLQNDAAFMSKMDKMRSSGATERQISEAWNKELDRRVDRYIEKRDNL